MPRQRKTIGITLAKASDEQPMSEQAEAESQSLTEQTEEESASTRVFNLVYEAVTDPKRQESSFLLKRSQLIEAWDAGVVQPLQYIWLILRLKQAEGGSYLDLDIKNFIFDWGGIPNPDNGRVKRLTERQIVNAIYILKEKGFLYVPEAQLSLQLDRPKDAVLKEATLKTATPEA